MNFDPLKTLEIHSLLEFIRDIQIHESFEAALIQFNKVMGESCTLPPKLEMVSHGHFGASVQVRDNEIRVLMSMGTADRISLFQKHGQTSKLLDLHSSLVWMIYHELNHAVLGHFKLLNGMPTLHLVTQYQNGNVPIGDLPQSLWRKVRPSLELQADHDAIELMLDAYSIEKWSYLRVKIASIAVVMVLIERHDEKEQIEHSTHPKAATRIFQLLAHVTEMWSLPAHAKAKARGETTICEYDLPSDAEKQKFSKEVILPAFWDAVALAAAAKAKSIISDLGSPEDFFADIGRAKLGQWDELVTAGAIEWAELKDANDLILPILQEFQNQN